MNKEFSKYDEDKAARRKCGRGSQKRRKVLVMASTVHDFENTNKYGKPTKFRYVRMVVVDNMKGQAVGEKVLENIKYDTVVRIDNYPSYSKLKIDNHLIE